MNFLKCKVEGVKADLATGKIKLSFSVAYNDDNMTEAEALAFYVDKDGGDVELRILPDQPALFDKPKG
jgi:hypothetical protein